MNIFKLGWWGNKKILSISTFFCSIFLLALSKQDVINQTLCGNNWSCQDYINLLALFSFLFFSFLFFSFFFLFQKNKDKFEKWRKFSLRYYLVYFVVVLIFPWHIGDAFLGFQKSDVVFLLTGLHFIISWFYLLGKNTK